MPAKDGFQTLMEIRNEKGLQIPIVMYSTSSETVFVKKSIEHGAYRFVIKPINFQDLKKILQKVIDINWDENSVDEENFVVRL